MIGTAIAVMREVLPSDLIPMSLARSCRAIVPLAPSQGLFLAGNEFSPFRTSPLPRGAKNFEDPPRLKMSEPILQRKEEFWEHVLLPHMVTLLRDDDHVWKQWVEMLEWARIPEDELRGVRSAYSDYLAFRANQRNDVENGDAAIATRF
jgi:tRNA pseudouridine38-40 synthase